jgi:hypothetical protein
VDDFAVTHARRLPSRDQRSAAPRADDQCAGARSLRRADDDFELTVVSMPASEAGPGFERRVDPAGDD